MPQLYIHATNSEFCTRDEGADYASLDQAVASGVRSALGIATDEIAGGRSSTAVEISIEGEDGAVLARSVLSISVSPILANGSGARIVD